jgi:hypothetical protein
LEGTRYRLSGLGQARQRESAPPDWQALSTPIVVPAMGSSAGGVKILIVLTVFVARVGHGSCRDVGETDWGGL